MATKNEKKIKVLSLFSGIGGLDLGFEKAGFEVVATLEWDGDCCDTLRMNKDKFFSKDTKIIQADITKIQPSDIYDGKVDFFVGGPPCQTFSAIGRRAGGASGRLDDRGSLFKHYCRLLKHYKPVGFMFENVRGILSSNKGQDWKDVLKEFASLGYKLKYRVLDTAGYGAPQHRERVILVGFLPGSEFFYPRPTHGPDSIDGKDYVTAAEALRAVEHTEDIKSLYNRNGKYDDLLAEIPPGMNYLHYTEEMGHPKPQFAWRSKFSDFLYKAHPNQPVKTIVASMGRYSGPFHWDGRKLSVGELLRLQGFPDGYVLCGGRTSKIKQIGNSVVPQFSYPLALAVKKTVFGDSAIKVHLLQDADLLTIDKRKSSKAKGTRSNRKANFSRQSSLFEKNTERKEFPNVVLKNAVYYIEYPSSERLVMSEHGPGSSEFILNMEADDGSLNVRLAHVSKPQSLNQNNSPVVLELSLHSMSFGSIRKLILHSDYYDAKRPFILWDAVNIAIRSVSPFPSIHELYGHFTEPNPKFSIDAFKLPNKRDPVSKLMCWMTDFRNTEGTRPLTVLKDMGFEINDERGLLELLRPLRIDLRTNLTNKRIKDGEFRVCYPYTLPIDRKTFVTIR